MRRVIPYLISLAVGLILGEVALRVAGARFSTSFYVIDPDLGWALRPGVAGTYTGETVNPIQINSAGMRDDREYAVGPHPGKYRVAILGDSFAEAMQVPLEQTFARRLESRLKACQANPEVMNFGVQGYGTAQELLVWRNKARAYEPDAVVLLFYTGNDLYNNQRQLNPTNADAAPYYVLDHEGKLQLEPALAKPSTLREAWASVVRVSKLAQFVTDAFYKLARPAAQQNREYMDKLIYGPPADQPMRQAWEVTEALLPQFQKEVESTGARYVLALASSGMQVHPDAARREEFLRFTGGTDLFYTENRLASRHHGAIHLGELLRNTAEKTGKFYHGFPGTLGNGHWNAEGHELVAEALASSLCGGPAGAVKK
jgi:lysophospholipase L1-like esterase